jgi:hypothetical protein
MVSLPASNFKAGKVNHILTGHTLMIPSNEPAIVTEKRLAGCVRGTPLLRGNLQKSSHE